MEKPERNGVLTDYRQHLRNKICRAAPAEKGKLREEKQGVTRQITELRKRLKYADGIKKRSARIDEETFMLVQEIREHRHRPTRSGIISMFSGILYCADCGEKLYYSMMNNYKREQAYFFCSS